MIRVQACCIRRCQVPMQIALLPRRGVHELRRVPCIQTIRGTWQEELMQTSFDVLTSLAMEFIMEQESDQDVGDAAVPGKRPWAAPRVEEVSVEALTLGATGPFTDGLSHNHS